VVLLIGITLVAFVVTHLVPGDPVAANLGQGALGDPAAVAAFRHQYGLDQPLPVQYLRYLGDVLHGNLGISEQSHRPVLADLEDPKTKQQIKQGQQLPGFAWLRDDGTTSSGNWLYCGSWTEAGALMQRRGLEDPSGLGIFPNFAWSWPMNRRVLYNRASCAVDGKPWDTSRRQVWWNDATPLGVPVEFVLFLGIAAISAVLLRYSLWGHYVIAVGSNRVAARYSGYPVALTLFGVYTLQGLLCGMTGILLVARLASARADLGQGLMLMAIAAVVLGGAPIAGGAASVIATVAGVAAFYIVQDGLLLLDVPPFVQRALTSVLLLVAVAVGILLRGGRGDRQ